MPAPIYDCPGGGAITLTAATARSVIGAKAHANSGLLLCGYEIAFFGVTASATPVLIEICYSTFATKSPGTNSTSITPVQRNGRVITAGFTAADSWAAANEPTVLTIMTTKYLTPNGGVIIYDYPLGKEPDSAVSEGFVIRCTAAAGVDLRATISVSRC